MLVIFFLNIKLKHLYFLFSSKNNNNNNKTISKFKIFLKSKKLRFFYTRDERCKSFVSKNENNAIVAKDPKT